MTVGGPHVLVPRPAGRRDAGDRGRVGPWLPETAAGVDLGLTAVSQPAESAPLRRPSMPCWWAARVYAGRWLEPAREYVAAHAATLRDRPVWLFSSGPIGGPPFPPDEPHDVHPLGELIGIRGHRVFPGRLDASVLGFGERAMVTAMRAPLGDFRDWAAVRAWAEEIAEAIRNR